MISFGYNQSNVDHTSLIKHYVGKIKILIVYVDDPVMIGDNVREMAKMK